MEEKKSIIWYNYSFRNIFKNRTFGVFYSFTLVMKSTASILISVFKVALISSMIISYHVLIQPFAIKIKQYLRGKVLISVKIAMKTI